MQLELDITCIRGEARLQLSTTLEGRLVGLVGPSGAGKTTLLHLIAGLHPLTQGRIVLNNRVLGDTRRRICLPAHHRRVGVVFQDGRLFPHLTVRRNLTYGLNLLPPAQRRIDLGQVVHILELDALLERRPLNLSGGERQRVALGRALLATPELLLLDEPLAALDVALKQRILCLIERVRDELAVPMIYVSHDPTEIARLADAVVTLRHGCAISIVSNVWHDTCTSPDMNKRLRTLQWNAAADAGQQPARRVG